MACGWSRFTPSLEPCRQGQGGAPPKYRAHSDPPFLRCQLPAHALANKPHPVALQDEDLSLPLHALLHTPRGKLTVGAEVVALLAMSPFLLLELGTVLTYGVNYLRDPSNLLDCATYALQIATAVMHLGRVWVASRTLTAVMAVQCILLMMRLQYFTQVFRPMRFSFPTIGELELRWSCMAAAGQCKPSNPT